jgi:dCTP diphosphatase
MTKSGDLSDLTAAIRAFADDRDWGQFHLPRSLVLALVGEVGELAETVQWVPDDEVVTALVTDPLRGRFEEEMADVLIYLLRLADVTQVDLNVAVRAKLVANEGRYPVSSSRGRAVKHDELRGGSSA